MHFSCTFFVYPSCGVKVNFYYYFRPHFIKIDTPQYAGRFHKKTHSTF
jgi:hypothetical protein